MMAGGAAFIMKTEGSKRTSARGHETIDHTADMGIRGWGRSLREAFEEIAAAMFEIMADTKGVAATTRMSIACTADDLESLLLEFLNGILAESDVGRIIPINAVIVKLEAHGERWTLEANVDGVSPEELSNRLLTEVKAATYYGAHVREGSGGFWEAQCVVDL
jgi:SHS2 domain-containing protein